MEKIGTAEEGKERVRERTKEDGKRGDKDKKGDCAYSGFYGGNAGSVVRR